MASYTSVAFFSVLLPVVVLIWGVVGQRARRVVLLVASYAFITILSKELVVFVAASTVDTYVVARLIEVAYARRDRELTGAHKGKRAVRLRYRRMARLLLAICVVFNLGILCACKYLGFFGSIAAHLCGLLGMGTDAIPTLPSIGAPIGISFYTLMAVSYVTDVYHEKVKVDRSLLNVALFLSFFPQIMEGPISRYDQTAAALATGAGLTRENTYKGVLRMAFGFMKKLVVADRINVLVVNVFDQGGVADGAIIVAAAALYTIQLYCDFSGTMDMALGMGRIFGVPLPENFRQPFFSRSAAEFWRRWHITLGTWFKDYVYYPVTLSGPVKALMGRARRHVGPKLGPALVSSLALFCVWMGNGLWHGAGTQYLLFGLYYFVVVFLGSLVDLAAERLVADWRDLRETPLVATLRVVRTLLVVVVGELIFRSESAQAALSSLQTIGQGISLASIANGGLLSLGMDVYDFRAVAAGMLLVLLADVIAERGHSLSDLLWHAGMWVRWCALAALVLIVIVFGAYGYGYAPVNPLYAAF